MKMKNEITAERLRELLNYDPETGVWSRIVRRNNRRAGSIAGTLDTSGYLHGEFGRVA